MKYELQKDEGVKRLYVEERTGNECETKLIYTDNEGRKWYGFIDLFTMPYMRKMMATKIVQLYSTGFTLEDIKLFTAKMKGQLKGNDAEKYEKVYSLILEMDALAEQTMDPVKQDLSLATVYVLMENEKVHTWTEQEAKTKLSLWRQDSDMAAFFLSWVLKAINDYTLPSRMSMQTASKAKTKETPPIKRTREQSELLKGFNQF